MTVSIRLPEHLMTVSIRLPEHLVTVSIRLPEHLVTVSIRLSEHFVALSILLVSEHPCKLFKWANIVSHNFCFRENIQLQSFNLQKEGFAIS